MNKAMRIGVTLIVAAILVLAGCPTQTGPELPGDEEEDWTPPDVEQLYVVGGDGAAALYWTEPGGAFDHVEVSWTPGGEAGQSVFPFDSHFLITGLTNGVEYSITVKVVGDTTSVSNGVTVTCTPTLQRLYGGSGNDQANAVIGIANGEYVIAGWTESDELQDMFNVNGSDVYMVRIDGEGAVAGWTTYGGLTDEIARDIAPTADDGYILCGDWEVISGEYDDFLALRLDSGTNRVFERALGGSGFEHGYAGLETLDGGFVFAGESFSSDIGGLTYHLNGDAFVVKLDADGATVWQQMFGGTGWDQLFDMVETSDGTLTVVGRSYSPDIPGSHQDSTDDFYLAKLDVDGALLWHRMFGGTGQDKLYGIDATSDGGFIVVGSSASNDHAGLVEDSGRAYVAKLDAAGEIVWHTQVGGDLAELVTVKVTVAGGYIAAGYSYTETGQLGRQGYVVKMTSTGVVAWERRVGGSGDDWLVDVVETPSGGHIVAGYSDSTDIPGTPNHGGTDCYVAMIE